jgi:queuine tRNA-ribosyltransferase
LDASLPQFGFQLLRTDGSARRGQLTTWHGVVETPVFMPVGTQATVKGLFPEQVAEAGATILLANTYHLALRPGSEAVARLGGLHRYMNWPRPILTDSGGFQIFSLAAKRKITDEAASFRSHIDGALLELSPERAVAIQEELGADIAMCLDECPGGECPPAVAREAVRRTLLWARRCRDRHRKPDQALFGIVQGGTDLDLRAECARQMTALDFPGYALGGFSVGEAPEKMVEALAPSAAFLPEDKPRYLMGVGRPRDLLDGVAAGIDMFDCVLPTRNGRNASAFTMEGSLRFRNARFATDDVPIEADCPCYVCRHYSRAYIHHLFQAREMLGPSLLSLHNIAFYCRLMREVREAIEGGTFAAYRSTRLARWEA